jgi:hypothetical protein
MRETLTIIGIAVVAALVGLVAFTYSEAPAPAAEVPRGTNVYFTELASGDQSTVTRRVNYLITSPEELTKLWGMITTEVEQPTIDFENRQVIAVFAGEEPTAGHTIRVTRVRDGDSRQVEVLLTSPGGSCILAEELTQPYYVIELPKTELALTHTNTATTTSCLN